MKSLVQHIIEAQGLSNEDLDDLRNTFNQLMASTDNRKFIKNLKHICSYFNRLKNKLKSFRYRLLQGKIQGVGTDRHDPTWPCDDDLFVLELVSIAHFTFLSNGL